MNVTPLRRRVLAVLPLLHPWVLAQIPLLHVAAANAQTIGWQHLVLPAAAALVLVGLLLLALRPLMRSHAQAAVVVSLLLIPVMLGGAVLERFETQSMPVPSWVWKGTLITLLIGAALALGVWLARVPKRCVAASRVLVAMSLLMPLFACLTYLQSAGRAGGTGAEGTSSALAGLGALAPATDPGAHPVRADDSEAYPDIYYIIADAYGRQDMLREVYGLDNSEFIGWLQSHGFHVAERSWSNYGATILSLASSLNMMYLNQDQGIAGLAPPVATPRSLKDLYRFIQGPEVARRLQSIGYTFVQPLTNWSGTARSDLADVQPRVAHFYFDELSSAVTSLTLFRDLVPRMTDLHHFVIEQGLRAAERREPTFTFIHLLLPHNPYVFDRQGRIVANPPMNFGLAPQAGTWLQREAHIEQLLYTNVLLKRLIQGILSRSDVDPIIILQGDHGTSDTAFRENAAKAPPDPAERLAILNAYRVPPAMRDKLYAGISPVNTFRLLLSTQFRQALPLLPDRSFASTDEQPTALADVTARLEAAGR